MKNDYQNQLLHQSVKMDEKKPFFFNPLRITDKIKEQLHSAFFKSEEQGLVGNQITRFNDLFINALLIRSDDGSAKCKGGVYLTIQSNRYHKEETVLDCPSQYHLYVNIPIWNSLKWHPQKIRSLFLNLKHQGICLVRGEDYLVHYLTSKIIKEIVKQEYLLREHLDFPLTPMALALKEQQLLQKEIQKKSLISESVDSISEVSLKQRRL